MEADQLKEVEEGKSADSERQGVAMPATQPKGSTQTKDSENRATDNEFLRLLELDDCVEFCEEILKLAAAAKQLQLRPPIGADGEKAAILVRQSTASTFILDGLVAAANSLRAKAAKRKGDEENGSAAEGKGEVANDDSSNSVASFGLAAVASLPVLGNVVEIPPLPPPPAASATVISSGCTTTIMSAGYRGALVRESQPMQGAEASSSSYSMATSGGALAVKAFNSDVTVDERKFNMGMLAQLQNLRHLNIAPVVAVTYDATTWGNVRIASSLFEGVPVSEMRPNGTWRTLDEQNVKTVAMRAASALKYMHKHGISHGNLHPGTILVGRKGTAIAVKLVGFGHKDVVSIGPVTAARCPVGRAAFTAPELLQRHHFPHESSVRTSSSRPPLPLPPGQKEKEEEHSDGQPLRRFSSTQSVAEEYEGNCCDGDAWSLGAVLYVLLFGQLPFSPQYMIGSCGSVDKEHKLQFPVVPSAQKPRKEEVEVETKKKKVMVVEVEESTATISPEAKEVLEGLLCFNPHRRMSLHSLITHPWLKVINASSPLLFVPPGDAETSFSSMMVRQGSINSLPSAELFNGTSPKCVAVAVSSQAKKYVKGYVSRVRERVSGVSDD